MPAQRTTAVEEKVLSVFSSQVSYKLNFAQIALLTLLLAQNTQYFMTFGHRASSKSDSRIQYQ